MTNRDEILRHIFVAVQKNSAEIIEKKPSEFDGIEEYLYIRPENHAEIIMKVKKGFLEKSGITQTEAWQRAEENTHEETKICTISEALFGEKKPDDFLFVVSNKSGVRGAGAITDKKSIKAWAVRHHTHRIAVLPSSIHEMLILDESQFCGNIEDLSKMVTEINASEVIPEERLTDRAYQMEI